MGRVQSDQIDAVVVKPVEDAIQVVLVGDLYMQASLVAAGLNDDILQGYRGRLGKFALDDNPVPDREPPRLATACLLTRQDCTLPSISARSLGVNVVVS